MLHLGKEILVLISVSNSCMSAQRLWPVSCLLLLTLTHCSCKFAASLWWQGTLAGLLDEAKARDLCGLFSLCFVAKQL